MDLTVYGVPLSPFVRKVQIVLEEKGVEYELKPVNIFPAPDWFAEISPARRIPVLRDRSIAEDATLADSSAICAYLERKHPQPALYPSGSFEYGRALWFEEYADTEMAGPIGMGVFRPIVVASFMKKDPDLETARKTVNEKLPRLYDYLESEISGRQYFVGDAFSIADISIATQLANLDIACTSDRSKWPQLDAFAARICARPSFAANIDTCRKMAPAPVDLS